MSTSLKIGYFAHWFQPQYKFVDFLSEEGIEAEKIDFSLPGYLEGFDVVIIEQNGFNDYIENDELYIEDWVKRGGIILFMHQDYMRWAPYFLPRELGYMPLVYRYVDTIGATGGAAGFTDDSTSYKSYMMPWIEESGRRLFSEPETIAPDEMLFWKIDVNTFDILRSHKVQTSMQSESVKKESVRTAALSCFIPNSNFEVIGSFMDPGVKDGALILKGKHGKGMYFINQILFPEIKSPEAERCLNFWRKYIKNLLAYFDRFKKGESEKVALTPKRLPKKKNYKLAIHMHSLDWYGCDSAPGTINALMRYMNYDVCSLAIKDNAPYDGRLDVDKYSDDKVLFLDGQEYHPFNWKDSHENKSHGLYHCLAMGINPDAYTQKYTCSRYSDEEIDTYLKEAVDYAHKNGGAICATHPYVPYWKKYDFDAVDKEPMTPLAESDVEGYWLDGGRIALMNSVDLFGVRRMLDNPAVNFVYLSGEDPTRDSIVKAIKAGHTIAAAGFDEADITIGEYLPGDELTVEEAKKSTLSIYSKIEKANIKSLRVYSEDRLIYALSDIDSHEIRKEIPLADFELSKYLRVEIEGPNMYWICNTTPFYLV